MNKVVVTGMNLLTPFAMGLQENWHCILSGKSCINRINSNIPGIRSNIAGIIFHPANDLDDTAQFNPFEFISPIEFNRSSKASVYALATSQGAMIDSGILDPSEDGFTLSKDIDPNRVGTSVSSSTSSTDVMEYGINVLQSQGIRKLNPFTLPAIMSNVHGSRIAIEYGLHGPNTSVSAACATGNHSIIDAIRSIKLGDANIMITGATESFSKILFASFASMKALTTKFNNTPTKASRPWDKNRNGFVPSFGAAILVLESYEHAKQRNAKIYAEIAGYGMSCDAYKKITVPTVKGITLSMQNSLNNANISTNDIDYINAHATSTIIGDICEAESISKLFKNNKDLFVSSTKSSLGHMLAASGAAEAIISILSINSGVIPATINLDNLDPRCDFGLNLNTQNIYKDINIVMSNSFGFGGTNSTIILKKCS